MHNKGFEIDCELILFQQNDIQATVVYQQKTKSIRLCHGAIKKIRDTGNSCCPKLYKICSKIAKCCLLEHHLKQIKATTNKQTNKHPNKQTYHVMQLFIVFKSGIIWFDIVIFPSNRDIINYLYLIIKSYLFMVHPVLPVPTLYRILGVIPG